MESILYILGIIFIILASIVIVVRYKIKHDITWQKQYSYNNIVVDSLSKDKYNSFIKISKNSEKRNSPISNKSYEEFMSNGQKIVVKQEIYFNDSLLERKHRHV